MVLLAPHYPHILLCTFPQNKHLLFRDHIKMIQNRKLVWHDTAVQSPKLIYIVTNYYKNVLHGQHIENVNSLVHTPAKSQAERDCPVSLVVSVLRKFCCLPLSFLKLPLFQSIGGHFSLLSLLWACLILLKIRLRDVAGRARSDVVLSYEIVSAFSQFFKHIFRHQICAGSIIAEDFCFLESRVGRTFSLKSQRVYFWLCKPAVLSQLLYLLKQHKSNHQQ